MKKSELRQLIREEISKVLKEAVNTDMNAIFEKYKKKDYGYYAFKGSTLKNAIAYSKGDKKSVMDYCKNKGINKFTIVSIEKDGSIDTQTY